MQHIPVGAIFGYNCWRQGCLETRSAGVRHNHIGSWRVHSSLPIPPAPARRAMTGCCHCGRDIPFSSYGHPECRLCLAMCRLHLPTALSRIQPFPSSSLSFSGACPVSIACRSSTSGFRLPSPSICPFRAFLSLIPFSRICRFLPLSRFYPFPFHFLFLFLFLVPLPSLLPPPTRTSFFRFLIIFHRKFVSLENITTFAKDLHEEKRPGDPTAGLRCRIVRHDPCRNTDIEPPVSGCMT